MTNLILGSSYPNF